MCDNIKTTEQSCVMHQEWEKHYDECRNSDGSLRLQNNHLSSLQSDVLYHLGMDNVNYNLPEMFGDVKFVCIGGTKHRMRDFAIHMGQVLGIPSVGKPINLTKHSQRYAMYKIGPVLSVSHGIGIPSMTILLQEVIKLLYYAKSKDPVIIRIGTSGGLGIPPGSVVISAWGLNGILERNYEIPVLGKVRKLPAFYDKRLTEGLADVALEGDEFKTYIGGTFAADDFYRGQARLDGPFCDYTEHDKLLFLHKISELGVLNLEMESTACAAYAREAGIRASAACVTFLDRLHGDQVTPSKATMTEWQKRPMIVVGRYIVKRLDKNGP